MEATAARASSDASAAVAHETSLFESFTAIPFVAGATLVPDPESDTLTLYVTTAQRDLAADGLRRSVAAVPLPKSLTSEKAKDGDSSLRHPSFGMEERGVLLSSVSPSGRRRLVARDAKLAGGDRGAGISFEVWEQGALVSEILVPPSTHGSLCVDGTFGGVSWSVKETRVAYVAEAPESEDRTPEWGMGVTSDAKTKAKKASASGGWRGGYKRNGRNCFGRPKAIPQQKDAGGAVAASGARTGVSSSWGRYHLLCTCWSLSRVP
jgi:acylaminoacyl-peptidase